MPGALSHYMWIMTRTQGSMWKIFSQVGSARYERWIATWARWQDGLKVWWGVLLTPIRTVARFCSRLILVTVFMYIVQGKNGLTIIYGRQTRKKTAYVGGSRRIQEAPDRQLRGQVWFGTINSIMALNRKGMGTWWHMSRTGLWFNVTWPLK